MIFYTKVLSLFVLVLFTLSGNAQDFVPNTNDVITTTFEIETSIVTDSLEVSKNETISIDSEKAVVTGVFYIVNSNIKLAGLPDDNVIIIQQEEVIVANDDDLEVQDLIVESNFEVSKIDTVLNKNVKTEIKIKCDLKSASFFNFFGFSSAFGHAPQATSLKELSHVFLRNNKVFPFKSNIGISYISFIAIDLPSIYKYSVNNSFLLKSIELYFFEGSSWNKPPPTNLIV